MIREPLVEVLKEWIVVPPQWSEKESQWFYVCNCQRLRLVPRWSLGSASAGPDAVDESVGEPVELNQDSMAALEIGQPINEQNEEDHPVVVDYFPNGKVKVRRQMALDQNENFVNHGDYSVHAPDGRKVGGGRYDMGQRTGEWTRIYDNAVSVIAENSTRGFRGPYTSTANFLDDELHGDWSITDAKERPIVLWQFSHGRREGHWLWFNADGTTRKQVHFKNDQIDGDIVSPVGKDELKVLVAYVDGRELTRHLDHFSPRRIKSTGYHLKPREETSVQVNWWNGEMTSKVVRKTGDLDRHGEWRFYHPNGKVHVEGSYDAGKEVGRFVWYHDNGKKSSEGYFDAGKKNGHWQMWYANGHRKSAGTFVNGKHDGTWMSWHENGMPKLKAQYSNGLIAESKRWDEDGQRTENIAARPEKESNGPRLSQMPEEAEADVSLQ